MLQKYITMLRADIKEAMGRRCGLDELNNLIMLIGFIYVVAALFTKNKIFLLLGAVFIILCYVRVFSKNLEKRKKENVFYMRYMGNVVLEARILKLMIRMKFKSIMDKEYAYFVCGECHQVIRVPKGKNKVNIRCPKCNHTFVKRT